MLYTDYIKAQASRQGRKKMKSPFSLSRLLIILVLLQCHHHHLLRCVLQDNNNIKAISEVPLVAHVGGD